MESQCNAALIKAGGNRVYVCTLVDIRHSTWRRWSRALKGNATDGITINDTARTRVARNSNRSAHLSGMFMSTCVYPAAIHSSLRNDGIPLAMRAFSISATALLIYMCVCNPLMIFKQKNAFNLLVVVTVVFRRE